jgi:hypothetical protein
MIAVMVQKFTRVAALAFLTMFALTPAAHAHGQVELAEIGAPLATSAVLGVASYWLVVLWPAPLRWVRDRTGLRRRRRSRAKISVVR